MTFENVLERAAAQGVDLSRLVIGRQPNQVPSAPSHCWIVFPATGGGTGQEPRSITSGTRAVAPAFGQLGSKHNSLPREVG